MLTIDSINYQYTEKVLPIFFILIGLATLWQSTVCSEQMPSISIIIDDVGDNRILGYRAANLPSNVALSILPHTPFSQQIAVLGHNRGMDILLHQPMESYNNNELLGPGVLLQNMERQQFARTLEDNINAVPFVVGINNHMGSLLTTDPEKMNWLMAELKYRGFFFIDSRTTSQTVATRIAQHWHLPTMSRRVFLDHFDEPESIAREYQRLLGLARKYGHAIAIGHPKINTLQFLEQTLPSLQDAGIELVSPSNIIGSRFDEQFVHNQQLELFKPVHFYDACFIIETTGRYTRLLNRRLSLNSKCIGY